MCSKSLSLNGNTMENLMGIYMSRTLKKGKKSLVKHIPTLPETIS